jgi:hypothetical protein
MPTPMAPRFLLLAVGSLLAASLGAQVLPAPVPAPPPTVTVRTTVSHLDPKTGKSDIMTAPSGLRHLRLRGPRLRRRQA